MADDSGVWVKVFPDDFNLSGGAPGAAVIDDAASNYDSKDPAVVIGDKTYDIYTFTTPTTTRSIRLTDEAQARITDEDVLMAVATANIPNDFDGDPVELFDSRYRDVLRNALEVTPAADPGLSLTVDTPGMADVLVVGAGGGGGCHFGSGGGAGGMLEVSGAYLPSGELPVRVGQGGAGGFKHSGLNAALDGYDGMASRVGSYVAPGGGGGVTNNHTGTNHIARPGRNGGSGSGGSGGGAGGNYAGGFAVTLLGNDGGFGRASADAGGGGGAGTVGGNAPSINIGGNGGGGAPSSITGSPVTFCGGGGGGGTNTAGAGGSGGGGKGGISGQNGSNGLANTGGGAGGSRSLDKHGGIGGSGIVIVRVEI